MKRDDRRHRRSSSFLLFLGLGLAILPTSSTADILITEVIPNVSTDATRGDMVELFNSGPDAVDLTGWILSDLDPNPIGGVLQDPTFAPLALGVPPLQPGQFAVVDFVDDSGSASWHATNYGLRIVAPLTAGSYLGSERDELLLADAAHTPIDFVAWADSNTTVPADSYQDLSAMTGVVHAYGLTPGSAAWDGPEHITSDAEYYAAAVDFTAYATVTSWGGGAIRRKSTNGVFAVGAPDGVAQWEAVPRHHVRLGNPSDDVPTGAGIRPIRVTDDLAGWLAQIKSTSFPERRLAPSSNQDPADFVAADDQARTDWQGVLALAMASMWEEAFAAADSIGYEVVEFLDTPTGATFHILRERFVPGEVGFTGMGTYVFYDGPGARLGLVLQVPHPIFDSNTLEQGALATPQVLPRLLMIAGTHRNNHTHPSLCDGTIADGVPYRISDVAHHPENFFHATHLWLEANSPGVRSIQFHGFCCPGSDNYAGLQDDCVLSNGFNAPPAGNDFTRIWRGRIDAQNFLAGGTDRTTAAVYGADASVLGATTNIQGRVTNGVAPGDACDTPASGASGRFIHIEQDPDVRAEPQHVITALIEALDQPPSLCAAVPEVGCRQAGLGKASAFLDDQANDRRDRVLFKWTRGDVTDLADFGDPLAGTSRYHLCIYDASSSAQPLVDLAVAPGGICGNRPCWKPTGTRGFAYRDRHGSQGGVTAIRLGAGAAGKAKLQFQAKGATLETPSLPLSLPLTAQVLVDDGNGLQCWQTTFLGAKHNTAAKLRAKQ